MKKISKYLLIFGIIIFPIFALAQIVPCDNCGVCDFVTLIDRLIKFALFALILPVCVIAFITAGIILLSSVGNPQKIERGKKIFFYALWGLIVAFVAFLIVHLILVMLVDPSYINFENGISFPECGSGGSTTAPINPGGEFGGGGGGEFGGGGDTGEWEEEEPPPTTTFPNTLSPEMDAFLECFESRLPSGIVITSTTDNNIATGACDPTIHDGSELFNNASNCQHSEYSCHYGGRNNTCIQNGSYAVDIDDRTSDGTHVNFSNIRTAANQCLLGAYTLNHGGHYHISIGSAYGCGCN